MEATHPEGFVKLAEVFSQLSMRGPSMEATQDPFVAENPGPARAAEAVQAAEQPLNSPHRAAAFAPDDSEVVKLPELDGQELLIYTIAEKSGDYGDYVDCVASRFETPNETFLLRIGASVQAKLRGVREAVERGECAYPLQARFDQVKLKNGNTFWQLS